MGVIVIDHLTKRYGRRLGVADLNLDVPEGAIFGFLGPNGSGKTTTLRVLMGFLRPRAGAARVFGLDCWRAGHRIKAEVGYLPGDLRLYSWMTCRDALRIFERVRRRCLLTAGLTLADEFGLDPTLRVRAMSRGMRQKMGLILALAHQPRLLILDEPSASLDPLMQAKLYARLRQTVAAGGTVFLSSHTLAEVEELCGHVAILREGKLVADASLDSLRSRARRMITIRWRVPMVDLHELGLDGIEWLVREPLLWRGATRGAATPLLRWIVSQPVEDVAIEAPNLAEIFREFYA